MCKFPGINLREILPEIFPKLGIFR